MQVLTPSVPRAGLKNAVRRKFADFDPMIRNQRFNRRLVAETVRRAAMTDFQRRENLRADQGAEHRPACQVEIQKRGEKRVAGADRIHDGSDACGGHAIDQTIIAAIQTGALFSAADHDYFRRVSNAKPRYKSFGRLGKTLVAQEQNIGGFHKFAVIRVVKIAQRMNVGRDRNARGFSDSQQRPVEIDVAENGGGAAFEKRSDRRNVGRSLLDILKIAINLPLPGIVVKDDR